MKGVGRDRKYSTILQVGSPGRRVGSDKFKTWVWPGVSLLACEFSSPRVEPWILFSATLYSDVAFGSELAVPAVNCVLLSLSLQQFHFVQTSGSWACRVCCACCSAPCTNSSWIVHPRQAYKIVFDRYRSAAVCMAYCGRLLSSLSIYTYRTPSVLGALQSAPGR